MYVIGINVLQCKIIRILVFKCEATENVLLPAACFFVFVFFFFIIPGKRNVKSTSFDEKKSGSDICVYKKNGKLNKTVVSN